MLSTSLVRAAVPEWRSNTVSLCSARCRSMFTSAKRQTAVAPPSLPRPTHLAPRRTSRRLVAPRPCCRVVLAIEALCSPRSSSKKVEMEAPYTGILPYQAIREMLSNGEIKSLLVPIETDHLQPASIDLRLGDYAFPVDTSFLPGLGVRVLEKMQQLKKDNDKFKIDLRGGAVLE